MQQMLGILTAGCSYDSDRSSLRHSDFGCRKKTQGCRGREHENQVTSLDKGRLAAPVVIIGGKHDGSEIASEYGRSYKYGGFLWS